jgi:hypothetical protein
MATTISWLKAFWLIFKGNEEDLGKGYKWKSGFLTFAIFGTVFIPFLYEPIRSNYFGDLPPNTPTIQATGVFHRHIARVYRTNAPYLVFLTDDGQTLVCGNATIADSLKPVTSTTPAERVVAEGFRLRDGKGWFWPLSIKTMSGVELLTAEQSLAILNGSRQYPLRAYIAMYALIAIFWGLSVINAYKLRKF